MKEGDLMSTSDLHIHKQTCVHPPAHSYPHEHTHTTNHTNHYTNAYTHTHIKIYTPVIPLDVGISLSVLENLINIVRMWPVHSTSPLLMDIWVVSALANSDAVNDIK